MPAIRRQVHVANTRRAVWNALTTAEGLEHWLADEARVDARAGGRFVLVHGDGDDRVEEHGIIHRWRPISHLEVLFDRAGTFDLRGSRLSVQVAADGDETQLTVVHRPGPAMEEDEEVLRAVAARWDEALALLQAWLDRD